MTSKNEANFKCFRNNHNQCVPSAQGRWAQALVLVSKHFESRDIAWSSFVGHDESHTCQSLTRWRNSVRTFRIEENSPQSSSLSACAPPQLTHQSSRGSISRVRCDEPSRILHHGVCIFAYCTTECAYLKKCLEPLHEVKQETLNPVSLGTDPHPCVDSYEWFTGSQAILVRIAANLLGWSSTYCILYGYIRRWAFS